MSEASVPATAFVDRVELEAPARAWTITTTEYREVRTNATGDRVERLAAQPDSALPMVKIKRRIDLAFDHVGVSRERVDEIAAVPGEHRLILWRHEQLAFRGNGARDRFRLPNHWTLATDHVAPPGGLSADRFAPRVKIGAQGAWLAVDSVDDATFDSAAPPPASTWFRLGGGELRLDVPLPPGEILFVRLVPEYSVFVAPPPAKRLERPNVEPVTLTFLER